MMRTQLLIVAILLVAAACKADEPRTAKTEITIVGEQFHINGKPTYAGRTWRGHKIEGLLLNARMACGIFDDANRSTAKRWVYEDTGKWDAERNTREFVAAMPDWRRHGLLAISLNLQGGCPRGYWGGKQPWENPGFTAEGELLPDYVRRAEQILDRADELGMVVILGIFYFGQDERLQDEKAVRRAVDATCDWLLRQNYRNVLLEIANESDNEKYDRKILTGERIHELVEQAKKHQRDGRRLLVGTSFNGGRIPPEATVRVADYLLLHGNGQSPKGIERQIEKTRELKSYRPMPIVNNEDDHYDFEKDENNFAAAIENYCSWGYFDFRRGDEPFTDGYQSLPVDWKISSPRKQAFFRMVAEISGSKISDGDATK